MSHQNSKWTKLLQPKSIDPEFHSLSDSVTRASTTIFDSIEKLRNRDWRDKSQYSYGLQGTPITHRLEAQIASLDQVRYALLYPSGLNAICMTLTAMLKTGDHLLIPTNAYSPSLEIARFLTEESDILFSTYNPLDLGTLHFNAQTKLVFVESPGSNTMEVSDLPAIATLAHRHGAKVAADVTWSAGIAIRGFDLGADICIHALTKYQSGGSDVLMGAITTDNPEIHDKLFLTRTTFGIGVSPDDCFLILRSLPHLRMRYFAQDQSARKIAAWLSKHPAVARVLHPAFESCPGHDIWQRDFSAAASLFSVVFNPNIPQHKVDQFVETLNLFKLGVSWGGAVSLVVPYVRKQLRCDYPYEGSLVRFYIGLEDTDDLIHDLEMAFSTL